MRFVPRRSEFLPLGGVLLLGTIWVNALWLQPGKHPAPLFRSALERTAGTPLLNPPLPSIRNENYADRVSDRSSGIPLELLRQVQSNLSVLGYYNGDVDGLDGPMTRNAVTSYEVAKGLPATGQANAGLLDLIEQSAREAQSEQAEQIPDPGPQTTASTDSGNSGQSNEFRLILSVQRALADLGYAPGPINGTMGQPTNDAIRRFQADRGMSITGTLTVTLVLELEAVSGVSLKRDT